MAVKPKKIEADVAVEPSLEVVAAVENAEPAPIGATLPSTADEQLAGQIAMASAEERLTAEIEAGKKAVADAQARSVAE